MPKTKPTNKINIGLVGYGTVGSGVVRFLSMRRSFFKNKFNTEFVIKSICDIRLPDNTRGLGKVRLTKKFQDILDDPKVDVIVELIGGLHPAKEIIEKALKGGKHVVTANKAVISNFGKELFPLAKKQKRHLYFESSVGAGTPIIRTITEGLAGNKFFLPS